MRIKRVIIAGACLVSLSVSFVKSCFALGFDNHFIGIKGIAMGNAIAGIADDASAVHHNPGGLAFLDTNAWQGEVYGYTGAATSEYTANSITDKSDEPYYIPGLFLSKTNEEWAFGFGLYIPYAGGGTSYDNFQGSPYDVEAFAGWYSFTFSYVYKLRPNLAVGVGISCYGGSLEMESFDPSTSAEVKSEYDDIYCGLGGNIGLMYKLTEKLGIGLVARTPVKIKMDGTVKIAGMKTNSDVEFKLPTNLTLGLGYQLQPNLTIGLCLFYRLYSDMPELKFKTSGVKSEMRTYFKDVLMIGLGADYKMTTKFTLRAGLKYDPGATKNKGLNAAFCEIDTLTPSIGIGYNMTKSTELGISVSIGFGLEEKYNSQTYDKLNTLYTIGIRYKF